MKQRYEVQTKFTYGWENVWCDEDGNLEYFKTKKQAIKALKENVDDWNNDPNTIDKYSYDDYRVVYSDKNNNKFLVFKTFISQTNTLHNLQANQQQAQAMTTENLQAQAIAYPQTTNTYPSTPQAQKNSWDAGNETILDEGTSELCCRQLL